MASRTLDTALRLCPGEAILTLHTVSVIVLDTGGDSCRATGEARLPDHELTSRVTKDRERRASRKVGHSQEQAPATFPHPEDGRTLQKVEFPTKAFIAGISPAGAGQAGHRLGTAAGSKKREAPERLDHPDTSLVQVKDSKERI
jgi:hypothetical protein